MSLSAQQLVRELAKRMGELILSTPTASGLGSSSAGTTLVDSTLLQYLPQTIGTGAEQFMPWVYGSTTVDPTNIGVTRRATMWNSASAVTALTFPVPWPTAITASGSSGAPVYEIYLRNDRGRFLEAINSGVGQLSLWWRREFADTSLTTATNTWSYTVPNSMYVSRIWQIEYQIDTSTTNIGFPYADAKGLDWELRESVDTSGVLTQIIQFAVLPPPNRTLRIRGEGYFPDLSADSDVLAVTGKWERPCTAWLYKYGACLLQGWLANQLPVGDVDRYVKLEQLLLQEAESLKMQMSAAHKPGRINVPGRGRGLLGAPNLADGPSWLAGFHGAGN